MADTTKHEAKPAKPSAPEPAAEPKSGAEAFPVERLITEAEAFMGCSTQAAAGAFHELPSDQSLTVEEAKQRVDAWLCHPLKIKE